MLRATQDSTTLQRGSPRGLSPSMVRLSGRYGSPAAYDIVVLLHRTRIATPAVWALPRSLATTWGIIVYFLFLRVLRCFSSPGWRRMHECFRQTVFRCLGYPIRTSPDQRSFASPRSFSQLITSFIASVSQGIRHAPFPTFLYLVCLFPIRGTAAHSSYF